MRRVSIHLIVGVVVAILFASSVIAKSSPAHRSSWTASVISSVHSVIVSPVSALVAQPKLRLPDLRRLLKKPAPNTESQTGGADAATVSTDKTDYMPNTQVNVSGTGWQPGETVTLTFTETATTPPGGYIDGPFIFYATAQQDGTIANGDFYTDEHDGGVTFLLTAKGGASGLTAQTTFTDGLGSLDQCANGPFASPADCTAATDWVSGNLGASKSHYFEGDSIPYRLVMSGLAIGSHKVIIAWDTTDSGEHAIDYLTSYNRTVGTADPCAGVSGCGSPTTLPIPADPNVTVGQDGFTGGGDDIAQIAGVFTIFGGTGLTVSTSYFVSTTNSCDPTKPAPIQPNTYSGSTTTCIELSFDNTVANPVLAWGGHIATRKDWGIANSAISIKGSPYHMRLIDIDGTGGNQDRSLSADAVFFPAQLTIVKYTTPSSAPTTTFPFTTTGLFATTPAGTQTLNPSFSLTPPGGAAGTHTDSAVFYLQDKTDRTITESDPSLLSPPFSLTDLACAETDGGLGTGTITTSKATRTASVSPEEGEFITCTFTNTVTTHTLKLVKSLSPSSDPGKFDLTAGSASNTSGVGDGGFVQDTAVIPGSSVTVSEAGHTGTDLSFYSSSLSCDNVSATGTTSATFTMPNSDVTCTVTNTRKTHTVKLIKALVPTNDPGLFNLTAAGTTANDQGNNGFAQNTNVAVGTTNVSVSEAAGTNTSLANYTSSLACVGVSASGTTSASFTMPDNDVTCTVTNTRKTHTVKLIKALVPTNDPGLFNLTAAGTTANDQGNNGFAQNTNVAVGTTNVSVSEAAGTNTSLANYTSSLACVGVSASGTTSASFTMPDSDVTCTVTNTRKTHTVKLIKALVPTNDPGLFNLTAAGTTANDQGNNGFAQNTNVAVGTTNVGVSEAAGTNTSLANYSSSLSCVGVSASGTTSASFTMPDNDVTCTVTNTRKTHTVKLIKALVPTNDPGLFNLTAAGTTANDQGNNGFAQNTNVAVGTTNVGVSEAAGTNTSLANYSSSLSCVGVSASGTTSASFTMPDNDVTCTVTNTRLTAIVKLVKSLVPSTDTGKFDLTVNGSTATNQGDGGSSSATVAVSTLATLGEAAGSQMPAGVTLTNYISSLSCPAGIVMATNTGTTGSFTVPVAAAGTTITCTVTNTRKGEAEVVKTVNGAVPGTDPNLVSAFTFDIRTGASPASAGTVLETLTTSSGNGTLDFKTLLTPGDTYQLCEMAVPGYGTTLGPNAYAIPDPNGQNPAWMCVDFSVAAGETKTFTVDNTKPTENGLASTIGFWKNWASCSGSKGKQDPVLDQTLALADPAGTTVGLLTLHAADCSKAVSILDKRTLDGKKAASDPGFNLAAQLLAAELNRTAGASMCAADVTVVTEANQLLIAHKFNGYLKSPYVAFAGEDAILANTLATLLDIYNNNGPCPTQVPPYITSAAKWTVVNGSGVSTSFTVTALGVPAPTISESGALPPQITWDANTATLTFDGGVITPKKNVVITFTATNTAGSYTQSFTIVVQ